MNMAALRGKRVLLCEDNMLNQEIVTSLLSAKGLLVDTAENGQRGLEVFSAAPPDTYQAILMSNGLDKGLEQYITEKGI